MTNFIPIFPLEIIVYPGEKVNLHVFEDKYKQLIDDVTKEKKFFGIPPVIKNKISETGAQVSVEEIVKQYDDGRMDIIVKGTGIFRILEVIESVPAKLYSGAIVKHSDNEEVGSSKYLKAVIIAIRELHRLLNINKDFKKPDEELKSYDVAHHAGLSIDEEYELFTLLREDQRIEYLRRHLKKIIPVVAGAEALKKKIQMNGHFKELKGFNFGPGKKVIMQTTLCFDFGNTRLKCAVFNNDEIKKVITLDDVSDKTIENLIKEYKPLKSILSSVIDHKIETENILSAHTKFHKLTHQSKLSFTTPVGKPETIGADRLALVAAAVYEYPNKHNLIIGLGSCITYNFVNRFHEFLGGSISPGLEMRFKAMNQFTSKLPLVQADSNFPLVGYDTKTNLQSGVILGITKEIDGIIDEYALRYGNFNAHLTGGDMGFFAPHLKNKIFANPYLIYKGLYAISETNS